MERFVLLLMRFEPVFTPAGIGNEGNFQGKGALHFLKDQPFHTLFLFRKNREVEFVVYLQNHFALQSFILHPFIDANHGHFNDVGSRTLDGCVDGISLSKAPYGGVVGVDIRQIATAVEHRFGISYLADSL